MIRTNIPAASAPASQFSGRDLPIAVLEEDMFGGIHQRMQRHGSDRAGSPLEHFAISESRDRGQNHVAPVRNGLRAIVEVSTAENQRRNQEHACCGAELLYEPVLDELAEQDFLRQRRS